MDSTKIKMWKAKLKASTAEERQWAKAYNRAERAMLRVGRQIDELERKTENELAKIKQRVGATQ